MQGYIWVEGNIVWILAHDQTILLEDEHIDKYN